jgi:Tfp pilus assembly protein PilV
VYVVTSRLLTALRRRLRHASSATRDAGFSLLEVMVAFTIFTILCGTATVAIVSALNAAHSSQQRIDAANVAQSIIAKSQAEAQNAANGTFTYTASVKQSEDFTVHSTIAFNGGATTCSPGGSFVVNVAVYQQQTNKFLARSDSVVTC